MANENEGKRGTLGKQAKKTGSPKLRAYTFVNPASTPTFTNIHCHHSPTGQGCNCEENETSPHLQGKSLWVYDWKRSGGTKKERESGADIVEDGMVTECFKRVSRFQVEQNLWLCFSGRELTRAWESRSKLVSNLRRFLIFYPDFASVLCKLVTC